MHRPQEPGTKVFVTKLIHSRRGQQKRTRSWEQCDDQSGNGKIWNSARGTAHKSCKSGTPSATNELWGGFLVLFGVSQVGTGFRTKITATRYAGGVYLRARARRPGTRRTGYMENGAADARMRDPTGQTLRGTTLVESSRMGKYSEAAIKSFGLISNRMGIRGYCN